MKSPEEIWLQWYGDNGEEPVEVHEDITWAANEVFPMDVKYIMEHRKLTRGEAWDIIDFWLERGELDIDELLDKLGFTGK